MKLAEYKNIWIDLTDIIDWTGHFTGIQRVEYELASRFKDLENVRFFYYHPLKSSFIETDFQRLEEKSKVASGEVKLTPKQLAQQVPVSKRISIKFKESIPHNTRMKLVKIKNKAQKISEGAPLDPLYPFEPEDLVLILGGNWAFASYMPAIAKVKRKLRKLKTVHVIYDLIPVFQPGFFPAAMEGSYTKYIDRVLKLSDLSLAISEYTKIDALKHSSNKGLLPPKIEPFRLGDDFVKLAVSKPKKVDVKKGKFLFCVGTFEVRKNHHLLYYAIKSAIAKGINIPKLVIVGKKGWLSDSTLHLLNNDPEVKDRVIILHKSSDKEMAWLYENCMMTVYPSYYEGWGLPIAESLRYGKMCLSSGTSSMKEVGGDLVDYFSPYDSEGLLDLIEKYLDPAELKKAEQKIKKNYKETTWDMTYNQVKEILSKSL
jgi:glycosyltransferase involved in cell wall biosynthesis